MQDIHTLGGVGGGGGGRIFSGGVERRLQPQTLPSHPPLKCPRCDSQNTKFCYYNNYNLSQPRHFCKNCRRYWTKGGVLRNVPIGGGCRKSKRSSKSKSSTGTDSKEYDSNNSHSSSESSSLTATTPKTVVTASSANDNDATQVILMGNSCSDPGLLAEKATSKGFTDQAQVDPTALDWENVGMLGDADVADATVVNVGVGPSGIGGGGENGLFDFTSVDESYWNHAPWVDDNDQAFNFLPQFQVLDFNLEKK